MAASGLSVNPEATHPSEFFWGFSFNFFLGYSLCLPPFALLSFRFRKQLFLHKLQRYSQEHVRQRQIACGCPGTPHFISAQTQHGLPGTTSVTRALASLSCRQPYPRRDPRIDTRGCLTARGEPVCPAASIDYSLKEH